MIIKTLKKEVSFEPENIVDGYKLGILREKCKTKQIPIKMSLDINNKDFVKIMISDDDLLTVIGIL
jgi:hypothetical protein